MEGRQGAEKRESVGDKALVGSRRGASPLTVRVLVVAGAIALVMPGVAQVQSLAAPPGNAPVKPSLAHPQALAPSPASPGGQAFIAQAALPARTSIVDQAPSWFGIGSGVDTGVVTDGRATEGLRLLDTPLAWAEGQLSAVAVSSDAGLTGLSVGRRGAAVAGATEEGAAGKVSTGDELARWLAGIGLVLLLAWRKLSDPRNRI